MNTTLLTVILLFASLSIFAQQSQYQTYTAVLKMIATKDGEQFQWENKNITVRLDYKTGEFISRLKNHDFQNSGDEFNTSSIADSTEQDYEYTFKGIFPIRDIINQKQISQNYSVELQLNNYELSIRETFLFNMVITRPNSGEQGNYRVFTLKGKLYNDQLNLPSLVGFDDDIEVWIVFNGFMKTSQ